jgi:hypothetical protein
MSSNRRLGTDSPFSGSNLPPFSIASLKELTWRLKLPSSEAQLGLKSVEFEFEVEVDILNRRVGVVVVGRNEAVRNAGLRWVSSLSEVLFINAMYALRERTVSQRRRENEWLYISRGDTTGRVMVPTLRHPPVDRSMTNESHTHTHKSHTQN